MTKGSATVTVQGGVLQGRAEDGITSFLGVPYAAAPFGKNRMLAPQPVPPWDGVRDSTAYGPTVPKGDYPPPYQPLFPEQVIAGEECLNLNVWTPDPDAASSGPGLPVLVWVHGGSFMNGSGSVLEYDGTAFARAGVVCVTINYRLAAEGFLFLDDGVANLGLQDQVAALRWVQENVGAFGGDPARVTVAGESAGAMSVTTLLAMPSAEGLFHQAITQSGATAHTLTPEQGLMVAGELAKALGVQPTRETLRSAPLAELVQAASGLVVEVQTAPDPAKWGPLALSLLPFAPTVDGSVLPAHPLEAFADGTRRAVPLLTGSNRDEARLFLVAASSLDLIDDAMLEGAAGAYGLSPDGVALYRKNRPGASPGDVLAAVITDWFFAVPALRVAEARAGADTGPTWVYRFDHPAPEDNNRLGACHAVEIPFVFGTTGLEETHPRIGDHPSAAVAGTAHRAWVEFIADGDPGWAPYTLADRTTGVLSETLEAVQDLAGDERALWEGVR